MYGIAIPNPKEQCKKIPAYEYVRKQTRWPIGSMLTEKA